MGNTLLFYKDQHLMIEGTEYCVTGGIEFCNRTDNYTWSEYCLQKIGTNQFKWLSVDNLYEEYAIYTSCPYSSEFEDASIFQDGYREADSGNAAVTSCFGRVDTEPGDTVRYTEYEDSTEELIMAVEQWEDETEYSRGYYLDADEIVVMDSGIARQDAAHVPGQGRMLAKHISIKVLVIAVVVLAVLVTAIFSLVQSNKKLIHKYLESSSQFTYQTSITSDLNNKEKADVYRSSESVDSAVKMIIHSVDGKTESVQKSEEDDSVAILTKYEYCLVYTSTDQVTTVQISSRAYVYQSTNTPYRATHRTHSYYRGYYYSYGFMRDRNQFSKLANGFDSYTGDTVGANPNDPYRSYSDSVRQSSINSRKTSGGGISSGK